MNAAKPNFFIVGAPKCGTSAMAQYLAEHPSVYFSVPKEPAYWCQDQFPRAVHEPKFDSLEDYLDLFSEADSVKHSIIAEGSTRYLYSRTAAKRILEFNPEAKFLVMLRNPVEMIHAYHMQLRYSLLEDIEDFRQAWRAQDRRREGMLIPNNCRAPELLQYGEVGRFSAQVARLYDLMPKSKIKIILLDDLVADVKGIYCDVLRFLNLPYDGRTDFPVVNPAHAHRYNLLAQLVLSPPSVLEEPMLRLRQHLLNRSYPPVNLLKRWLNQRRPRPKMQESLVSELEAHFSDDVRALSEMLGRDLRSWIPY